MANIKIQNLLIGDRQVGPGNRCFVIAEVAQAHDGSLGTAHAYIDAAAKAGADAVKFQTHIASAESTKGEPFRVKFSKQDANRYDYWKRMEFTAEAWRGLAEHARERGLVFLSTPFSMQAIDLLQSLKVPAWKVGSGELTNLPMLEKMSATKKPVLLSSGMASWEELDTAVATVTKQSSVAVFQCTTAYPCPAEKVGLNVLGEMRDRYSVPVGLSDHSGAIYAGLAAASMGANLIEAHIVFSRDCFGPDVPASLTTVEFAKLAEGIRFIEDALANPLDKDQIAGEMTDLKSIFGKSVVLAKDVVAGHVIAANDITLKKPGTGIPPARMTEVIGRKVSRPLTVDTILTETDFE